MKIQHTLTRLSDIQVGKRIRHDYHNVTELAENILRHGLIHPILIDHNKNLVAGGRRLQACQMIPLMVITMVDEKGNKKYPNGLPSDHPAYDISLGNIPCTQRDKMSELELREMELDENLHREGLSWQEEAEALAQIDEIKRKIHGENVRGAAGSNSDEKWTLEKTAALVEKSPGTVSQQINLAKKLRDNPELKKQLANLPLKRALQVVRDKEQAAHIQDLANHGQITFSANIQLGNCVDHLRRLQDNSVDMVWTDPPFGNETISNGEGKSRGDSTTYTAMLKSSDNLDEEQASTLLGQVIPELYRVMKPGSLGFMCFSFDLYPFFVETFRSVGFQIDPTPIIWDKGKTTSMFQGYMFMPCYEPILYFWKPFDGQTKGRRLQEVSGFTLKHIVQCSTIHASVRTHAFEKPLDLIVPFIKAATNIGDVVLDPFAGVGSTIIAAMDCRRSGIGFELDNEHYLHAQKRVLERQAKNI